MAFVWEKLVRDAMFVLDAEQAHELGLKALQLGLGSAFAGRPEVPEIVGPVKRFGLTFANPLGMAAGFDKNGVVVNQLARLGFGFVEVGTVTYEPQPGNPKPRLFRLPQDKALINRLGFNNEGATAVTERLRQLERLCVVGVNIGRNKEVPNDEAIENYLKCFELVHPVADYITVNVSSPNTPGLRDLQQAERLGELLSALQERNSGSTPVLVKISPDLTDADIESVADVAIKNNIAGIIATNTTISRGGLKTEIADSFGAGGVSGKPLTRMANEVTAKLYRFTKGTLPIIGVGGIFTAEDMYRAHRRRCLSYPGIYRIYLRRSVVSGTNTYQARRHLKGPRLFLAG